MPTSRFVTPSSRFALLTLLALVAVASAQTEEPKSEPAEIQAIGGHSVRGHISGDGRFVAFDSYAKNLIPGSENEHEIIHVFVHDRHSGITKAASLAPDGTPGNGNSAVAALSADGRLVAFQSAASNLVAGDTNGFGDIFVREIVTGATTRVSVATGGAQASGPSLVPALSANGRFVAFESMAPDLVTNDTNNARDIFVHDRQTGTTTRVSIGPGGIEANGHSYFPSISGDGRYVAFESAATNLVPGDTNGFPDVFVHDRQTGVTTRVSVGPRAVQAVGGSSIRPHISADGRFVVFDSEATNLVPNDTNKLPDVFVHDRQTRTTDRVNVATSGAQAIGGPSFFPSITADGRFVVFQSDATNLVRGDTNERRDIFVHDRQTATTSRVSVATGGVEAIAGGAARPQISADGRHVVFESGAINLVPDDTNGLVDIFVHDRQTGATTRVNVLRPTTAAQR